jgi:hypothetical protein
MSDRRKMHLERVLKHGADDLMNLCKWALRDHPRALKRARKRYVRVCVQLDRAIGRAQRNDIA